MLDKLYLRSLGRCNFPVGSPPKELSYVKTHPDKFYSSAITYRYKNHFPITVKTLPVHTNLRPLRIELNPSKFEGYSHLLNALELITSTSLLEIIRLDHACDLEISLQSIHPFISVPRKSIKETYKRDKVTGFYFGKKPNAVCIYDKSPPDRPDSVTRFEVRQEGEKILPALKLNELGCLLSHNPFRQIKIMRLVEPPNFGTPATYSKLQEQIKSKGLHLAAKSLGNSNNFGRTYRKYLEPMSEMDLLVTQYHEQIKDFLRGKK